MYYNSYSYPFNVNHHTPMYQSYMSRNQQDNYQQILQMILEALKRGSASTELYRDLYKIAPSKQHKEVLLTTLSEKEAQLNQLGNLYFNLTGIQPSFENRKEQLYGYRDGLQRAFEKEVEDFKFYQESCLLTIDPNIRNVFLWALSGEQANTSRIDLLRNEASNQLTDFGPSPFVVDIEEATVQNNTFRTALWTGKHLQLTLMSINVGEDIGLEIHPHLDQFLRIEQGQGLVQMGESKNQLDFEANVYADYAIIIPAGTWHNLTNTGNEPLKLYSIYAPPQHPFGTVHETKA